MQRWEYRVIVRIAVDNRYTWSDAKDKRSSEQVLNDMGKEGWELVTVSTVVARPATGESHLHYIFRRPPPAK
jgi:hypothetical protein